MSNSTLVILKNVSSRQTVRQMVCSSNDEVEKAKAELVAEKNKLENSTEYEVFELKRV